LKITASAAMRVPSASSTPDARPPSAMIRATRALQRRSAPRRHPARDGPDPGRLGAPDQHQQRRRQHGRAADIGGVASERLAQPRVVKTAPQHAPQGRERRHRAGQRDRMSRQRRHNAQRAGGARAYHRRVERIEQHARAHRRRESAWPRPRPRNRRWRPRTVRGRQTARAARHRAIHAARGCRPAPA
jgi:hypothetical protein